MAGTFLRGDDSEHLSEIARGYSGFGAGKNNPAMQDVKDIGPLPAGWYVMTVIEDGDGNAIDYEGKKAPVIRLTPEKETEMFGRAGMLMHGDFTNPALQGTASHGCVIEDHTTRVYVASCIRSGDNRLRVI